MRSSHICLTLFEDSKLCSLKDWHLIWLNTENLITYGHFEGLLAMAHGRSYLVDELIWVIISKNFSYLFLLSFSFVKPNVELMSKELNHFGVIAGLFWQIGSHSSRFVLFCSFWRLFTIKMIKSVKVFPFSFWKIITIFFFFIKFKPPA